MKIVVFGGAGFIGSHVADALSEKGYNVRIFDIKDSPYIKPGQEMMRGDILNEKQVYKAIQGCEIVYNFVAIADIDECKNRPIDVVKYNILGNTIILESCRKLKVKRFVFASSVYVYSDVGAFYKSSKQTCELFIEDYHKLYRLPYTILRYGSLYGSRADSRNSVYRIIKEALIMGEIIYYGTGNEIREFIHVRDAAQASVDILDPSYENECITLTGQRTMKYKNLLEMIKEMLKGKIKIIYKPKLSNTHYNITPYVFNPKFSKKMSPKKYIDMAQGLHNCMSEIYAEIYKKQHKEVGILVKSNDLD